MKFLLALLFSLNSFAGLPPTTTRGNGESTNITTFNFQFPNNLVSRTGITTVVGAVVPRENTIASSSTPTPVADTTDIFTITALAASATFGVPTYSITPTQGQSLIIRIKDNGTPRALAFNAIYHFIGTAAPNTTVANKLIYLAMMYNSTSTQWDVVGVNLEQ